MIGSGTNAARARRKQARRRALVAMLCAVQCLPFPALAGDFPFSLKRVSPVVRLAREIDHLEKEIDKDGSVTAKHPDVWSEERLTQHRFEYEQQLAKRLGEFEATLSAQIRRSDQAFLATATAITSIVNQTTTSAEGDVTTRPGSRTNTAGTLVGDPNASGQQLIVRTNPNATTPDFAQFQLNGQNTNTVSLEPTVFLDQMSRYLHHLHALRRIGEGEDTVKLPGYALNLVRVPISINPGQETRIGHGAEVTLSVEPHLGQELLPTTFENFVVNDILNEFAPPLTDFLNSPDLNYQHAKLVEYAIDSLYQNGIHWSDSNWWTDPEKDPSAIAMWISLSEKLLLDEDFNGEERLDAAREDYKEVSQQLANLRKRSQALREKISEASALERIMLTPEEIRIGLESLVAQKEQSLIIEAVREYLRVEAVKSNIRLGRAASRNAQLPYPLSMFSPIYGQGILFNLSWEAYRRIPGTTRHEPTEDDEDKPTPVVVQFQDVRAYLQEETHHASQLMRRPENQRLWRFCTPQLVTAIRTRDYATIQDIRANFFASLDPEPAPPFPASAAGRTGRVTVPVLGDEFRPVPIAFQGEDEPTAPSDEDDMDPVDGNTETGPLAKLEFRARDSVTAALAWAVLVHAALLNERMTRDMQVTFDATDNPHDVPEWLDFYQPDPSYDARWLFNEYVRARWPVRVFAIDPVAQEQNVGDRFNQRREFQLALAVAFATGQIGIDQMTRFSRRLELDMETIALNRTVVGFSQGDDTFGWRFLPRIQTPPTPSNASTIFRDMLIGGRSKDDDLKHYRLEPGPRECIALVLKPAFLRQLRFDVRTDWFRLDKPSKTRLDLDDMVELSETMHELDQLAEQCAMVDGTGRFRGAEVRRLQRRLDQLAHELPLQTIPVETPVENHLAGFQVFVPNGYYDLSPQIFSWYGLPGVNVDEESTIFILGSNLRPHGLRVIVGNKDLKPYFTEEVATDEVVRNADGNAVLLNDEPIQKTEPVTRTQVRVLSESVIELKVPAGVKTVRRQDFNGKLRDFVQVQVATHHGVSQSLLVPAWENPSSSSSSSDSEEEEEEQTAAATNSSHATVQIQVGTQGDASQTVDGGSRSSTPSSSSDADNSDAEPSVTFDWKEVAEEFTAVVRTTADLETIQSVDFDSKEGKSELKLQASLEGLPGKNLFNALVEGTPMLAFWVRQLTVGGRELDRVAIGPFRIEIDDMLNEADVESALVTALNNDKLDDDTRYLELVGYLRFSNDSLPITKLGKSLKLKLKRERESATTAAPRPDATSPADADEAPASATPPESASAPTLPPLR